MCSGWYIVGAQPKLVEIVTITRKQRKMKNQDVYRGPGIATN